MSFLVGPLDEFARLAHLAGVIVWVGLLHFLAFIRPQVLGSLGEGTAKEVLPHLAARLAPWLSWGSTVAAAAGLLLYLDRIADRSFAGVPWELHVGSLVGLVMLALTHGVALPGLRRVAGLMRGLAPPSEALLARTHGATFLATLFSWPVLVLMVLA